MQSKVHVDIELNPDAVAFASQLGKDGKDGGVRGPLHGLPILLKDLIATGDRMNNIAGSFVLLGAKVTEDYCCSQAEGSGCYCDWEVEFE